MPTSESHARRLVEAYGHNFDHIDNSWLQALGVDDDTTLRTILSSRRGQRSLTLSFIEHYELRPTHAEDIARSDHWALQGRTFLLALALRVGVAVNADYVRTAVTREAIGQLRHALGEAACRRAIEACATSDGVQVLGLTRHSFDAAVGSGDIKSYLALVGQQLLRIALPETDGFAQQRLRFAFRTDEDTTSLELTADRALLSRLIVKLAGNL